MDVRQHPDQDSFSETWQRIVIMPAFFMNSRQSGETEQLKAKAFIFTSGIPLITELCFCLVFLFLQIKATLKSVSLFQEKAYHSAFSLNLFNVVFILCKPIIK